MEIIFVGTILIAFFVFAVAPALKLGEKKKEKRNGRAHDSGVIMGNGKIIHNGELINLKEARRRGLKLEFEKKSNERKPMAWR